MRLDQLKEAVRYGAKEKQSVLSDLDNYGFGFEIELNKPGDGNGHDSDHESLEDYVIDQIMTHGFEVSRNETKSIASAIEVSGLSKEVWERLGYKFLNNVWSAVDLATPSTIKMFKSAMEHLSNPTEDLFKRELIHGTLHNLVDAITSENEGGVTEFSTLSEDLRLLSNELKEYVVLYLAMNSTDDEKEISDELDELTSFKDSIKMVYKAASTAFSALSDDLLKDGEIKPYSDMSDEDIESITAWFQSSELSALDSAYNELTSHSFYDEGIDFTLEVESTNDFADRDVIEQLLDMYVGGGEVEWHDLMDEIFGEVDTHFDITRSLVHDEQEYFGYDNSYEESGDSYSLEDIEYIVRDNVALPNSLSGNLTYTDEADGQVEIIMDEPASGKDILSAYKGCFDIIDFLVSDRGFSALNNSGLHMSISYKDGENDINMPKFLMLSNLYNVLDGQKEFVRNYVSNIFGIMKNNVDVFLMTIVENIEMDSNDTIAGELVEGFEDLLSDSKWSAPKFKSVNFQHYMTQGGRVELRFFGGEGYESERNEFFDILVRSMYALELAFTDTKQKEYYQEVYKLTNKLFTEKYNMDISDMRHHVASTKKLARKLGITDERTLLNAIDAQRTDKDDPNDIMPRVTRVINEVFRTTSNFDMVFTKPIVLKALKIISLAQRKK